MLLLLLALAACSLMGSGPSGATQVVLPTRTTAPIMPPTFTPIPSWTARPAASPTATETSLPTSTPTSTPTATPTPCAEPAGRVIEGSFPSPVQGGEQPYRIYLPPCYGQTGQLYPALYLFHGNIHTEKFWDDLGVDELADAGIGAGDWPPFVIVMPFGGDIANDTSGGDWSFEGVVLNELIPYIEDQYCVWPAAEGRAIGGISRGGYWSLEIGFRHPELFAAVAGHSPAIFWDNAGPAYNPLTTGLDPRLLGLPIYIDIGDNDWLRQGALDLHAAMEAAGIPHVWQLNAGAHENAYWQAHLPEYLAWYLSQWPADAGDYPAAERVCRP